MVLILITKTVKSNKYSFAGKQLARYRVKCVTAENMTLKSRTKVKQKFI